MTAAGSITTTSSDSEAAGIGAGTDSFAGSGIAVRGGHPSLPLLKPVLEELHQASQALLASWSTLLSSFRIGFPCNQTRVPVQIIHFPLTHTCTYRTLDLHLLLSKINTGPNATEILCADRL